MHRDMRMQIRWRGPLSEITVGQAPFLTSYSNGLGGNWPPSPPYSYEVQYGTRKTPESADRVSGRIGTRFIFRHL